MTDASVLTGIPTQARPGAKTALFILFLANVLNLLDRSLLGIVTEPVRQDLLLSDTQMSILNGAAFVLFNLVAGIVIAHWVDHWNRKKILLSGALLWTTATAMTGMSTGFYSMAFFRILVGVGEATVFPIAISMIGDYFVGERRPKAVSLFMASNAIGFIAGASVAGVLTEIVGWRVMFQVCGVAGILVWILIAIFLNEPPRENTANQDTPPSIQDSLAGILKILKTPGLIPLITGYGVSAMTVITLTAWGATFLVRSHGISIGDAGAIIAPAIGFGGTAGMIIAGLIATRLVARSGRHSAAILVPIVALPLAGVFFTVLVFAPALPVAIAGMVGLNILISSSFGPCLSLGIALTSSLSRGKVSIVFLMAYGILGGALAPYIVGVASDLLQPSLGLESLRYAMGMMILTPIIAALILLKTLRTVRASANDLCDV